MPISHSEFLQMQQRVISNRKTPVAESAHKGCDDEGELHQQILDYCNKQWPKWKVIHARMDKRSTIDKGAQDFTIFQPEGKTLCIECKRKGAKLDDDQRNWQFEMSRLSHVVHTVRSMEEFLNLITTKIHDNSNATGSPETHHVRD